MASGLTNMLGRFCARTGALKPPKKTQRQTPFWGPNFVPETGAPNIPSYDGPHFGVQILDPILGPPGVMSLGQRAFKKRSL